MKKKEKINKAKSSDTANKRKKAKGKLRDEGFTRDEPNILIVASYAALRNIRK